MPVVAPSAEPRIANGNNDISNMKNGFSQVLKVYSGSTLVWKSTTVKLSEALSNRVNEQGFVLENFECVFEKLKNLN